MIALKCFYPTTRTQLPLRLIGGGILVAIATGAWGLAAAGAFLAPLQAHPGGIHLSTSMLFEVGVYAAVLGLVMMAFNLLGTSAASVAVAPASRKRAASRRWASAARRADGICTTARSSSA